MKMRLRFYATTFVLALAVGAAGAPGAAAAPSLPTLPAVAAGAASHAALTGLCTPSWGTAGLPAICA